MDITMNRGTLVVSRRKIGALTALLALLTLLTATGVYVSSGSETSMRGNTIGTTYESQAGLIGGPPAAAGTQAGGAYWFLAERAGGPPASVVGTQAGNAYWYR